MVDLAKLNEPSGSNFLARANEPLSKVASLINKIVST